MNKNCQNCYWKHYKEDKCTYEKKLPVENICDEHTYGCQKCEDEQAEYSYNGKVYCLSCLLKEFEIEESIVTHYYSNGEYLGSDDNMDEVISRLDSGIRGIDD